MKKLSIVFWIFYGFRYCVSYPIVSLMHCNISGLRVLELTS